MKACPLFRSFLGALMLVLASCQAAPPLDPPEHEKETAAAWLAFKGGDVRGAIRHADVCIREFRGAANRRQKELDDKKELVPSGRVNAAQKEAIFKNGPLNDVATCYYIKALSAARLGQRAATAAALLEAAKYPAARAWDPRGWFWAPAVAAEQFRTNPELAGKPPHEAYAALTWAAFNRGAHAIAIKHADRCIAEFHQAAQEMEQDLAKRNIRLPTGEVDEATKQAIFENGLLNDVAVCLLLKGQSAEARGDRRGAVAAYRDAAKLSRARSWDPRGWFWSPAEKSGDRLEVLR